MNEKELAEQLRLTKVEVAGVCGRFSRLKEESKKPIGYSSLAEMAALKQYRKAFNTPITKEVVCPYCKGTGLIGGTAINDLCFECEGTGKLDKTFTIKEAIERMMKDGL